MARFVKGIEGRVSECEEPPVGDCEVTQPGLWRDGAERAKVFAVDDG